MPSLSTIAIALISPIVAVTIFLITQKRAARGKLLSVERIRFGSSYLFAVLDLYEKRIDRRDRVTADDIIRWLKQGEDGHVAEHASVNDYFLVALLRERIAGAIFFHYYPDAAYAFVTFVVVDDTFTDATAQDPSLALLNQMLLLLRRDRRGCKGIVADLPATVYVKKKRNKEWEQNIRGKIVLFRRKAEWSGLKLFELPAEYIQPDLTVECRSDAEKHGKLLYIPLQEQTTMTKDDIASIWHFVYFDVLSDSFDGTPDEAKYRNYIEGLFGRVTAAATQL